MKCHYENREKVIARYLARELSEQETEAFEAHYVTCDDCFRELQFMSDALELVATEGNAIFKDSLERHKRRRKSRLGKLVNLISLTPAERGRVLTFAAAACLLLISLFVLKNPSKENVLDRIAYNNAVPYSFNPGSLWRGSSNGAVDLHEFFSEQFQIAMFSYKDLDYQSAIAKFAALQDSARKLETTAEKSESFWLLREYHFYRGISYFALARNPGSKLSTEREEQLLQEAIQNLLKAVEMAQIHALNDNDKLNYFLGLAYGFSGKRDLAVEYLRMIQPGNPQLKYVPELIDKWSQ